MEPEKKQNGALVGLVVIVIVLVIGGIYVFMQNQKMLGLKNSEMMSEAETQNLTDQDASALNALEQASTELNTNIGVDADAVN